MATPCVYTFRGKDYSYEEFSQLLHDSLLDELTSSGAIDKTKLKGESPSTQSPSATEGVPSTTPPPNEEVNQGWQGLKEGLLTQEAGAQSPALSGIKKALAPEDIVELTPVDRRTNSQVLEEAKRDVDSGKVQPQKIIDEIKTEARALQPNEVGALVYHKAQLDNQVNEATSRLKQAQEEGNTEEIAKANSELQTLNQQLNDYYEMSVKTASQQSMAFRLRKMLVDSEYNLQSQVAKYKAANNGNIPDSVQKKFEQLDQELKEANRKIDQLQKQHETSKGNEYIRYLQDQERRTRRKAITAERKQKINKVFDSLKIDTSSKGTLSASVVPGITLVPHLWNGSVEVIRQAVLAGADVASAIQAGIDYIKANSKESFDEDKYRDHFIPLVDPLVPKAEVKDIPEPRIQDGRLIIPKQLIKELVAAGANNIEDLTTQIRDMVKDQKPDITLREVRDAITKYGKTTMLSQEDLDVKIRELKRAGRMMSQMEDIQKKIRPLRSGLQRDKLSDQERRMQKDIREALKDIPISQEEEEQVWKSAIDKIKSRLKNQISDLEEQIKTGKKTPPRKGIEYDEEAIALQAQRDELKKTIESLEGKEKISDEQRLRSTIRSTERSLDEYERRIREKDFSKEEKRGLPESAQLNELRAKRDAVKQEYQKLKEATGEADKQRLENRKKSVTKAISEYQRRIKEKDFVKAKPKDVVADAELQKALAERERVKYEFELEQEKARLENRSLSEKITDFGIDAINLPKSLISSLDFSAALRQGGVLLPTHPVAWAKSFVEMFKQAASQKRYDQWMFNLKASDIWPLVQQSKLFIADNNAKLSAREELFLSRLARKIPIIGQSIRISKNLSIPGLDLIGASNRAYAGFLNNLRLQVFAAGSDQLKESGITFENNPDAYKSLADFVNNATGRGKLLKAGNFDLENAAPVLNSLFFSPRFLASRLNLMNPVYYAKLSPPVRKMALKSSLSYLAFGMAILAMFAADDDWEVEQDPRSTDFGKIKQKNGNTRYDIWGGFQGVARFLAQMATGQRKTASGNIVEIDGKKYNSEDRLDVAGRFLRGKLAPVPGSVVNAIKGENIVGEPVTLESEVLKNVVPLYLQDMKEIFEKEGAAGGLKSGLPAMFGIGVQNYLPGPKNPLTIKQEINKDMKPLRDMREEIRNDVKENLY